MTEGAPSTRRPRLPVTADTAFWLEGAAAGELRIQRCASCAALRHPPRPMCPTCQSLEWDDVIASGNGVVFSYVVYQSPPMVGLPVPYIVAVVQLDEGVRVVGNIVGCEPADVRIDLPVEVVFVADPGDDLVLPQWQPRGPVRHGGAR
jgi:uncharacterized protein